MRQYCSSFHCLLHNEVVLQLPPILALASHKMDTPVPACNFPGAHPPKIMQQSCVEVSVQSRPAALLRFAHYFFSWLMWSCMGRDKHVSAAMLPACTTCIGTTHWTLVRSVAPGSSGGK